MVKLEIGVNDTIISLVADIFPNSSIEKSRSPHPITCSLALADNSLITGQNTICSFIASSACGDTQLEKAQVQQWLTLSNRFESDQESINLLQSHLETRTWVIGNKLSLADVVLLVRMIPVIKSWTHSDRLKNNHIVRWFDFIQHQTEISESELEKIQIDLNLPKSQQDKTEGESKNAKSTTEKPKTSLHQKDTLSQLDTIKSKKKHKEPKKAPELTITPGLIDLRVGQIVKVEKHPDADTLYVETIDVGEPEPRTVVSGLVKHIPIEDMQDRKVILVCNLKPAAMRGVKSFAMVLCASNSEGQVEIIDPPKSSKPGDRAVFEGYEDIIPESVLNPKKKIWEKIQPDFTSTESKAIAWIDKDGKVKYLLVNGEKCFSQTLVGADIR